MGGFEMNKVLGAILGTCLFTLSLNIVSGGIFAPKKPAKPGYDIAVTETAPGTAAAATVPDEPIEKLLASANLEKGATVAKKCLACHDFAKGGPNKVGPNLYGIVMRKHGTHEGFSYSEALAAKASDDWTYEALNEFVKLPKAAIPGTKMTYPGMKKNADRANLLAYLATLSDAPVPFPAP